MDTHTNTLASARACTTALLARCEEFIAGFEDDATQEGVPELLAGLRELAASPLIFLAPIPRRHTFSNPYGEDGLGNFAHTWNAYWYRMYAQRTGGWPNEALVHFVKENQNDQHGGMWQKAYPAVIDDFGNLVEVAT